MAKILLQLFLFVAITGSVFGETTVADRWETLRGINLIENPNNSSRPGRHGELGPYQFRSSTWRQHTKKPFTLALQRLHADEVAVLHYEWIKRGLARNGIEATPYNIALAWNAGLTAAVKRTAGKSSHRYAQRVVNVVADLKRTQADAVATAH